MKYDFITLAVRSKDKELVKELAFRFKMPQYKVIHMLLEERREADAELRQRFELSPQDFEAVRAELKKRVQQIREEARG